MKRFLLSSVLMLFTVLFVAAQTVNISGTVTDQSNGQPVAGQTVYIMTDSSSGVFFYYNQVITNNQGFYNDLVPVPANLQVMFYIGTIDCNNNFVLQTAIANNGQITADFSICISGPTNCQADFFAIPDSGNPSGSLTYYFADVSVGNPIAWSWDFGDGTTSALQYPTHTYTQPGVYNVCLTIATSTGCTSTYCQTVTVNYQSSCYAYFNYTPDPTGFTFQFTDASIGSPTSWQWSFGDGTSSSLQNPTHSYNAPGAYYVCLTISGNNCQSTWCDYIFVNGPQNCMAQFMAYPDSGSTNNWLFNDFSTGNVISWSWNFGDGNFSALQYPAHTYAQNGTYLACLTIFTSDSCTSTYCDSIFVGTNPNPCQTYFIYNTNGNTASFSAWSYGGTSPYTYVWDFGDGTTSTLPNPSHTYAAQGSYNVTLTGSDAAGCSSTYTSVVWIGNIITGTIYGQVFAAGAALDHGWVYLYTDGGPANPMLLMDSTVIDSIGHYFFMILNPLPGNYYVKAVPDANSVFYSTYLPTYYSNTIFWANATPINLVQPTNPYNITLVPANGPIQGNGNINGQVTTGGKFNAALSAPAPNVEIMLLDMSNNPLAMKYSDNQGYFAFNSIALGTYKIYAEITGLPTDPAVVTLTGNNPTVNNVTVVITPNGITTGVDDVNDLMNLTRIYPVPACENITVEFSVKKTTEMQLSLMNILGEQIISKSETFNSGNHHLNIQLNDIEAGTYFISLHSNDGTKITKKINVIK